jgi:hypothetical protein
MDYDHMNRCCRGLCGDVLITAASPYAEVFLKLNTVVVTIGGLNFVAWLN